ncbi:MAG: T9SS type A sorting domain-containing protein, partial [Bacteroidetes bacterium]|nr:T9SS type A sorting domain-containing protein [Bacteroidota bacterium]
TLNNCSSSATQSITVDQCSSIDELDELLSIFPNPSDGNFTIFGEGITSIKCFTLDGRALSYDIDKIAINELSVQLKEPSGSYVVQIIKSGKSFYFPIIVY